LEPRRIDLNVDIGEGFPWDDALLEVATSANVGAGAHAGSWQITLETVEKCRVRGVAIGLHPGYPDRDSMGRAPMPPELQRAYLDSIVRQVRDFLDAVPAAYLKPHGAFYNETARVLPPGWNLSRERPPYAEGGHYLGREMPGAATLSMLLRVHRLPLLGLTGTAHEELARRAAVPFLREGFADRAYRPDGTLVPREEAGAVLTDPGAIRAQVVRLAERVDSICLHGDTPGCVAFAQMVRRTLEDAGYEVGA
jgi:UPF0271 protein